MTESTQALSELRQRMIEDMRMCQLAPMTQVAYLRAAVQFSEFLRASPNTVSVGDLRLYRLHPDAISDPNSCVNWRSPQTSCVRHPGSGSSRRRSVADLQHLGRSLHPFL